MTLGTAKILFASVSAAFASASAHAATGAVQYSCAGGTELTVQTDGNSARVSMNGRSYDLQRKHSSIGAKYLSAGAALIIDGPSAVFVAESALHLGPCIETMPMTLKERPAGTSR